MRVVMVVGVIAGCGAALPKLPSQGGPAWIEVISPHFTLWTDAGSERAGELIQQMERMRQIVVGVAFPRTPSSSRAVVIALRDDEEFAAFSPAVGYQAYALPAGSPLWQPMFVLPAFSDRDPDSQVVAHELTHVISFASVRHQPRWLAEGIAQYFETVSLDLSNPIAAIGSRPPYRGIRMKHGGELLPYHSLISVSDLLRWRGHSAGDRREYYTAWALYAFVISQHRPALTRYVELIDRTDRATQETGDHATELWDQAFPSLPLLAVDAALRRWLFAGSHRTLHFEAPVQRWPHSERALGDADALAIRALLHSKLPRRIAEQRAAAAAARAADPTNTLAWLLHVLKDDGAISVDQARAVATARPDDWRAWLLVMLALHRASGDPGEFALARATLCQLAERDAVVALPGGLCGSATQPAQQPVRGALQVRPTPADFRIERSPIRAQLRTDAVERPRRALGRFADAGPSARGAFRVAGSGWRRHDGRR
jgi:hypothetical protein